MAQRRRQFSQEFKQQAVALASRPDVTITPRTRAYIQQSDKIAREFAEELGNAVSTVRHWRSRDDVYDRPHTAKMRIPDQGCH